MADDPVMDPQQAPRIRGEDLVAGALGLCVLVIRPS
jgi:hypothetical protein